MGLVQEDKRACPVRIRRSIDTHAKSGVLDLSLDNVNERLEDSGGTGCRRSTTFECERNVATRNPPITLRAGRPDHEDGLAFAGYLDIAAEGFFRFWLGRDFSRAIADAFMRPGHDLSYERATFAVRGEKIIGMALCYTADEHRASSLAPLRKARGYPAFRAAMIAAVFSPIFRILDTIKDGDFYLQAIAVDPDLRGAGVGSLLFDWVEDQGRASDSRRLCLDVSGSNIGARRLYERLGMNVVSESKIFYIPGVRLLRMAKAI
jgi:ribosomal protein S18 acetylase RimI-like enzyme